MKRTVQIDDVLVAYTLELHDDFSLHIDTDKPLSYLLKHDNPIIRSLYSIITTYHQNLINDVKLPDNLVIFLRNDLKEGLLWYTLYAELLDFNILSNKLLKEMEDYGYLEYEDTPDGKLYGYTSKDERLNVELNIVTTVLDEDINNNTIQTLSDIEQLRDKAVQDEDYELAAKYNEQMLKFKQK